MKKLVSVFACIALTLSLSGCSGNNVQTNKQGDAGNDNTGEIVLSFPSIWVGSDSKATVFGKIIEDFNAEYAGKYKVKVEDQTDYDGYRDKIRTLISTGTAPDIFTVQEYADLELYASSGKILDLTEFLAQSDIKEKFIPGIVENTTIEGKNFGMPFENAVIPIMYNKKLLDQVGVTSTPTSYDEFWEMTKKLKDAGIFVTAQMTGKNAWTSMLWYSYALAAVGGKDVYKNGFDDPAFEKAADLMVEMFKYTSPDSIGADATVVNGHFFNERIATYTNGSWILGRVKTEGVEGLYDNLIISPGLSYEGQNGGAYINTVQAYLVAGNDSTKAEAVKEFFKYAIDKQRITDLTNSSGALFSVSINPEDIKDPLQAEILRQSEDASFMIGHFQSSVPTPAVNAFPALLEALVLEDITSKEFVDGLKKAVENN